MAATALRLEMNCGRCPRVARASQPLGFGPESRWDSPRAGEAAEAGTGPRQEDPVVADPAVRAKDIAKRLDSAALPSLSGGAEIDSPTRWVSFINCRNTFRKRSCDYSKLK